MGWTIRFHKKKGVNNFGKGFCLSRWLTNKFWIWLLNERLFDTRAYVLPSFGQSFVFHLRRTKL